MEWGEEVEVWEKHKWCDDNILACGNVRSKNDREPQEGATQQVSRSIEPGLGSDEAQEAVREGEDRYHLCQRLAGGVKWVLLP